MTDLIMRDAEPALVERVQRWADRRGWSLHDALVFLVDRGLASTAEPDGSLAAFDARVLEEAIIALENVPNDPGFALIGRAAPPPPARAAPDQSIFPQEASETGRPASPSP